MEDLENLANTHLVSGGRNADWLDAINCATTMLISAKWATESPFVCFLCVIRYVRTRVKKGFKKQVWVFSAMADAMSEAEADNWATVKQCAEGYTTVDMQVTNPHG